MPSTSPLAYATELDAVNTMLAALGEAPIANLGTATAADVVLATDILRRTVVEVQTSRWRFNTEFGFRVSPSATYDWDNVDNTTDTLNIFRVPTAPPLLVGFDVSAVDGQLGEDRPDVAIRRSRRYMTGNPSSTVLVFYDRAKNRDGFKDRDYLFIDPVWALEFNDLPPVAQRYIGLLATRQFLASTESSREIVAINESEIARAYRALKDEEGQEDTFNVLRSNGYSVLASLRQQRANTFYDPRRG